VTNKELLEKIKAEINEIRIINTHEHTLPQKIAMMADDSYLFNTLRENAFNYNLEATGMPKEAWMMKKFNLKEAWKRVEPFIKNAKSSPYYRWFMCACRDLFGIEYNHIDDEKKWIDLSEKMAEANRRKDWYEFVLKKKAKVDISIVVQRGIKGIEEVEREFFRPAINLDDFVRGYDGGILARLEEMFNTTVETFEDYLNLLDTVFKRVVDSGVVTVKSCQGYERSLDYELVSEEEAKRAFPPARHLLLEVQDIYPLPCPQPELVYPATIDPEFIRYFQDFIMHRILENASKYNIPVQIHTGLAPTWENIWSVNPVYLTKLIRDHKKVRFDLLHGGFPFAGEMGQMSRFWPNVYVDLAWMPIGHVGYTGTKRVLSEWMEYVPWYKIMWGGDTARVEELYGAVLAIRQLLSEVLAEKVETGWGMNDAIELGRRILRENALEFYRLT